MAKRPRYAYTVLVELDADHPDEGKAWLDKQLADALRPGEDGSEWARYGKGVPSYVVSSVREVRPVTGPGQGEVD